MKRAFTLIEILVSLTITMMMMLAVVTLFGVMTDSVSGSRAVIEMSERLRACRNRLQTDLIGATASMLPPLRPENDEGYFEAIEGINADSKPGGTLDTRFGDTDDLLMFTTRSSGEPFVGKFGPATAESQAAEIAWFIAPDGTSAGTFTLYRRVRLVAPLLTGLVATDDVSAHPESGVLKANTLGDLTKPENRWMHTPTAGAFPFRMTTSIANLPFMGPRLGDGVILTNVLAFDVQLYDPGAPTYLSGNVVVEPRDAGYAPPLITRTPAAYGAYVDLGYRQSGYIPPSGAPVPIFNSIPAAKCGNAAYPFAYDTWSLHYENDGLVENGTIDAGTNGLDDNGNGIVDDIGEFDTQPPYPSQLRGLRVTIRAYEPSSQQIRQVEIIQDFLPD